MLPLSLLYLFHFKLKLNFLFWQFNPFMVAHQQLLISVVQWWMLAWKDTQYLVMNDGMIMKSCWLGSVWCCGSPRLLSGEWIKILQQQQQQQHHQQQQQQLDSRNKTSFSTFKDFLLFAKLSCQSNKTKMRI